MDPSKAKWTFYFSEGRRHAPSDLLSIPEWPESCMNEPKHTRVKKHTRVHLGAPKHTRVHQSTPTTFEHTRMCISTPEHAHGASKFLFWWCIVLYHLTCSTDAPPFVTKNNILTNFLRSTITFSQCSEHDLQELVQILLFMSFWLIYGSTGLGLQLAIQTLARMSTIPKEYAIIMSQTHFTQWIASLFLQIIVYT